MNEKEKQFYDQLGALSRSIRRTMENTEFDMRGALHEAGLNPEPRAYLPHGLTEAEVEHSSLQRKLSSCIKSAEVKCCGKHTKHYETCSCNPVAVCRAAIEH